MCFLIVKVSSSIVIRDFDLFLALVVVTLKDFFELKFLTGHEVGQNLNEISNFFFWQMSKLLEKARVCIQNDAGTHNSKL